MPQDATSITRRQIDEYVALEAECVELRRKLRTANERQAQLKAEFQEALQHLEKASVVRFGQRVSLVSERVPVQWMKAFIKVAGTKAADELKAQAATKTKVVVQSVVPATLQRAA